MRGRVLSDATGCRGRGLTPSWDPSGTSEQCLQYYSPPCDRTLLAFCHSFWTFQHTQQCFHTNFQPEGKYLVQKKKKKNQTLRQQQCEQNQDVVQCCKFYRGVVTHVFHRKTVQFVQICLTEVFRRETTNVQKAHRQNKGLQCVHTSAIVRGRRRGERKSPHKMVLKLRKSSRPNLRMYCELTIVFQSQRSDDHVASIVKV